MRSRFMSFLCGLFVPLIAPLIAADPLMPTPVIPRAVTIITNTGEKCSGVLKSWAEDKILVTSTMDREFAVTDLRKVIFENPLKKPSSSESTVWLSDGDRISAKVTGAAGEMLKISWPVLGLVEPISIPLERIVAMIFEWPVTKAEQQRLLADIATLPSGSDLVMFKSGDRSQGEFQRLDSSFAELKGVAGSLKLDRSRIRAIRLNPDLTMSPRKTNRRKIVTLSDGSRITATSVELNEDQFALGTTELGKLSLPVSAVIKCEIFSEFTVPISDYEPVKVEFVPYLSANWKLVRNANVRHGPLMLRDSEFTTGLGMHSKMAVTYKLRGNEREFRGIVGIDDTADGAGSAVFAVDLDGQRIWTSPELTGKSPAFSLPLISVQSGKQLTLIVDFGQYADVADYADWCDAVLTIDATQAPTTSTSKN